MPKTIAIYFSDPEPMGYPFTKPQYVECYRNVAKSIEEHDINVCFVRGDSYRGNGTFDRGWHFQGDALVMSDGVVHADLIFNRDDKNTIPYIDDCPIINHPAFDQLCVDKQKTYEEFPDISPKTAACNSYEDCLEQVGVWGLAPDSMVVLKKNFETEGRGIHVIGVKSVTPDLYTDWRDVLVQEFLDSSIGIPGITDGMHDLRVTVVNGQPINAFLRIPKAGSFLANISQGGAGRSLELEYVPEQILSMVRDIDDKVQQYVPAVYAADFMNSKSGYKLIELNSRPGLQHPDWSSSYKKFNDAIVAMLVDAVQV